MLKDAHEVRSDVQPLYYVIDRLVPKDQITKRNRAKSWKYGYDKKYDMVVISKTGQIGEIIEVGFDYEKNTKGLYIALPPAPKKKEQIFRRSDFDAEQYWERREFPHRLRKLRTKPKEVWDAMPRDFQEKWWPFINEEFHHRDNGMWFMNNGTPTWLTGKYWFYLTITPLDIGIYPEYREANRIFFYWWEACLADSRCLGSLLTKIRRSGFSNMACSEMIETMTMVRKAFGGLMSKTGDDTKSMFQKKLVPMHLELPFYFRPSVSGNDIPKTEIKYERPSKRVTEKSIEAMVQEVLDDVDDEVDDDTDKGLMSSIAYRATSNSAFDSENMERLIHDEVFKWEKPFDILQNMEATVTTLRKGSKITGKINAGSTMNPMRAGGKEGRILIADSNINQRDDNGWTFSGLYHIFITLDWNFEGHIDRYGLPVFFADPKNKRYDKDGVLIEKGCVEFWFNRYNALEKKPKKQSEFVRQNPRFLSHALREPVTNSIFPTEKLNQQIDYNGGINMAQIVKVGRFAWVDGVKADATNFQEGKVKWIPDANGRFRVTWIPPAALQNRVEMKRGKFYPLNGDLGAFGADTYDISGTVDANADNSSGGSKGALHGFLGEHMGDAPRNFFFLEYVARPRTAEEFYEDLLMAMHFYGMPVLAENNKIGFLKYIKARGYRPFSINRPDKPANRLSSNERELGGIPSSSEAGISLHAEGIESYVDHHVGVLNEEGDMGHMYFTRTLNDWMYYEIKNRTMYDATISSGLAIMAVKRHALQPKRKSRKIVVSLQQYNNQGTQSEIIDG